MSLGKLKVRLVLQGQHMKQGVKYEHSYSPVPHASGFRTMLALTTAKDMLINHVDINQAFLQDDMLEEEGFEGNVYISPPPGYDSRCSTLPRADSKAHTKDLCTTI